jgi:FAD/FMN-containing dehydrogenase
MNTLIETPETHAIEALRDRLQGTLLQPQDQGYVGAAKAWNLNAEQHPALVVLAECAADVVAAVQFARQVGIGVGVMATGHGVGAPCDRGMLVNTSRMRGVSVDSVSQTARVEAGALWKDVIPLAQAYGLAGLAGSAPHVGVVGYTMGGGFGWLGRKFGLNAASVTAADVVTAAGELLHVSANQHTDLFWGLKGGGGNFGIVTALEFRLYPLATVFGGAVFYPVEQARDALNRYADWTAELPDEVTSAIAFMNIPPLPFLPERLRGRSVIVIKACYCGAKPEDGENLFRPMREGLGEPIMDTFGKMSVAAMDAISKDPVDPMGVIQYTGMLSNLSPETIDALVAVAGAESGSPLLAVELRQLSGALARTPEQLNPMGRGNAQFSLNVLGATFTPEMAERGKTQIARLIGATRQYQTGETFLNYLEIDPAADRVRAAYPPEDWERLVALKNMYDPENVFRFNRNIPPSLNLRWEEGNGKRP